MGRASWRSTPTGKMHCPLSSINVTVYMYTLLIPKFLLTPSMLTGIIERLLQGVTSLRESIGSLDTLSQDGLQAHSLDAFVSVEDGNEGLIRPAD
jgi:hypothetical protein